MRREERRAGAHVGRLPVLDDAAQRALGGAERAVEHVDVFLTRVALLLDAAPDLERARLCMHRRVVTQSLENRDRRLAGARHAR